MGIHAGAASSRATTFRPSRVNLIAGRAVLDFGSDATLNFPDTLPFPVQSPRRNPGSMLPSRHLKYGAQAALLASAFLLRTRESTAASGRLLVFLHLPIKQRALQTALSDALPGVMVTAVGRIADFDRALASGQDAVLTLPVVLVAKGLPSTLAGVRGGANDEKYALVGAGTVPDPASVKVVGALDLLGRAGTTSFVHTVLGAKPKVERVTKVEDLLALLQMQRAEAILLPSRLVPALKGMSRLTLATVDLSARVRLPAACSVGPSGATVLAAIGKLPSELARTMGIDAWR